MRASWLLVIAAALGMATPAAHADEETTRAVVWIRADSDNELLERVRGQVADLDVTLIPVRDRPAKPRRGRQVARALGREHDATIVIWFRSVEDSTSVYVADLPGERLLVREIEHQGDDEKLARSAAIEAAAMVVRSSVRALAAGGTIGVKEAATVPTQPVQEPIAPGQAPPIVEDDEPSGAYASVGALHVLTGSGTGHPGFLAGVGMLRGKWRVGIDLALGVGEDDVDAMTTIRVSRASGGLHAERIFYATAAVQVGASLTAGALTFERTTLSSDTLVPTAPARLYSAFVSPAIHARWQPFSPRASLEVSLAADVLSHPPTFGYEIGGQFVERKQLWPVTPRVGVSFVVETQ